MRRTSHALLSAALVAAIVAVPACLAAQQTPAPQTPLSREERIRQHNEKIEKILEENRRRQAEEAAKRQAQQSPAPGASPTAGAPPAGAAPTPAVAQPVSGTPLPAGPVGTVTPAPATAAGQTPPPGKPEQPKGARSEARSLMYFRPFDALVHEGDVFSMDVIADTREGVVDEVAALIKYSPSIFNPLAFEHTAIDPLLSGELEYLNDTEQGLLYFKFPLAGEQKLAARPIVKIYWEALKPTQAAQLQFSSVSNLKTGLFLNGSNIMGTVGGVNDGMIHANLMVREVNRKPIAQKLDDGGLIVSTTEAIPPAPSMSLQLRTQHKIVAVGEEFDVDVVLNNPEDSPMNHLQMYVQFDPAVLQVVDTDRGNWIREGTNILDAFAHDSFPFDFHRANVADNRNGRIFYEMGKQQQTIRSSGTFARIRFKALAPADRSDIVLASTGNGRAPTTDVRTNGISVLADKPPGLGAVAGLAMTVDRSAPRSSASTAKSAKAATPAPRTIEIR